MSVADLLDDWFEHDGLKGSIASSGVVGVWAGPRTPGTAYNLLHHALGEIDGIPGGWGQVIGGMGAISTAIARSAEDAGAVIRTDAEVASIDVRDGRVVGVTLADGSELRAPIVASGAHPKTTILDLAGGEHFPEDVSRDMRRYRTRGGSVKINMVLSEPPRYERVTAEEQHMLERTGVNLCPSIDYLERAWQDATLGKPAEGPYIEVEVPTSLDPTLTDDGTTVMTMFTQYGPHDEAGWPEGAREAYAGRCFDSRARGGGVGEGELQRRSGLLKCRGDGDRVVRREGGGALEEPPRARRGHRGLDRHRHSQHPAALRLRSARAAPP